MYFSLNVNVNKIYVKLCFYCVNTALKMAAELQLKSQKRQRREKPVVMRQKSVTQRNIITFPELILWLVSLVLTLLHTGVWTGADPQHTEKSVAALLHCVFGIIIFAY